MKQVDFCKNDSTIAKAWARVPVELNSTQRQHLKAETITLLKQQDAVLLAHYYVPPDLQDIAEETGGIVADSLDMAKFGANHKAKTLVVAGVKFMGETAKILSPEKRVLMPDLDATCSLDIGCPADEFKRFIAQKPGRTVVVYANTSAAVKAMADWVVTSAIGLNVVKRLHEQGKKILWAPDKHLGNYIQEQTGADMVMWNGNCIVHDEFKAFELELLIQEKPEALVLAHPESPAAVLKLASMVGSTGQIIKAAQAFSGKEVIVATDAGIFHKMQQLMPDKIFIRAPTAGNGATCKSCAFCPWMAMNGLVGLNNALKTGTGEIKVNPEIIKKALIPLNRMVNFK